MKKFLILIVSFTLISIILSSCSINIFKSIDSPENTLVLSKEALSASKEGNTKTAIKMAVQVFEKMSNGSLHLKNFYNSIVTSDTSSQARVELFKLSKFLETTKSTNTSLKYASKALMNSITKMLNLNAISTAENLFSNTHTLSLPSTSQFSSSDVINGLEFLLKTAHNLQLMTLLQDLGNTIYRFDPKDPSALFSMGFYAFFQVPIILFDSNGNGVLEPKDAIYKYLWDYSTNSFKTVIPLEDYNHIMNNLTLETYQNLGKSQKVLKQVAFTVTALDKAMNLVDPNQENEFIRTLRKYVGRLEIALYVVNADMLSKIKTFGSLMKEFKD